MSNHKATQRHSILRGVLLSVAFICVPQMVYAAPGTLANVPLFTQANADPNIMLHLDSSGSMRHIVPESPYDDAVTYDADPDVAGTNTCTSPLAADTVVTLDIASGVPKIRRGGTNRDLGNDTGEDCFDPSLKYYATLHDSSVNSGDDLVYSGNYLNWYFTPSNTTGTWVEQKPETNSRMEAAKTAYTSLVNSMSNVRAGFSKFDGQNGADISVAIDDIATNRSTILTAISGTSPSGYTPLAESLRDIGRYFSNDDSTGSCGGGSTNLTLHPNAATPTTAACTSVLDTRITINGPIEAFCQQNFTILTTDGLATKDRTIDSSLTDYDDDCSATAQSDGGYTCSNNDMKDNSTYASASYNPSDYLDDVAQALYEIDLRPDLDDSGGNDITNNMRTFVIGFADDTVKNNPLLIDTADQGGGEFIFAENTAELYTAFQSATQSILDLIGSAAAVTFNSATLGTNSAVYLALFNSSSWTGDLVAYDLDDNTGAIDSEIWSAADQLNALSNSSAVSSRVILSFNGSKGIPFRWPGDYTNLNATTEFATAQINDLLSNAPYADNTAVAAEITANDTFGQNITDYIRGDNTLANSTFRARSSRLGDIIHGGPVFVGGPELNWPDGTATNGFPQGDEAYSVYKYNISSDTLPGRADRPGVVYIGGNDGMLHGFATETGALSGKTAGDEVLAYVPKVLFSTVASRGLHYLTESGYNHQYYVDQVPTISDIHDGSDWKTILIGALRGGARGIFALDITDPANFSEANADSIVLGEFTNADDADLGYTFSRPAVALMENGRWAVIVGNGYNADTGNGASGQSALFVLFLDADLSDGWDLGTDYFKILTGAGDGATPNGLSTPAIIDTDGDGRVDRAYAGDLLGNMWAFDLSSGTAGNWDVAYIQGGTKKALFSAGSTQPITTQPAIVMNPDQDWSNSNKPNVIVLFGTGQYVANGDNAAAGAQAFYGIWDDGPTAASLPHVPADLQAQTITQSSNTRTVTTTAVDWSSEFGWYVNLTSISGSGERVVTDPVVRGDIVYFNTSIPNDDTCSFGGSGWLMSVNYSNGGNPDTVIFDHDGNGILDGDPLAGIEFTQGLPASPAFLGDRRYTPGTSTSDGSDIQNEAIETLGGPGTGRLSWEELVQ